MARDRTTPPTSNERSPLAQVLDREQHAARQASPQMVEAAMVVRELAIDVVQASAPNLTYTEQNKLADELVKAVRAKPTRWAFIRLAEGDRQ